MATSWDHLLDTGMLASQYIRGLGWLVRQIRHVMFDVPIAMGQTRQECNHMYRIYPIPRY